MSCQLWCSLGTLNSACAPHHITCIQPIAFLFFWTTQTSKQHQIASSFLLQSVYCKKHYSFNQIQNLPSQNNSNLRSGWDSIDTGRRMTKQSFSFPVNMKYFILFVDYNIIERRKKIFFSSFALRGSALWHLCHFSFLDI